LGFQGASLEDCELSDLHLDTHQSSNMTGVAWGLKPLKPSEGPERYRGIEASEFGISEFLWTRDRVNTQ
jgi:hypothetical protein